MFDREIFNEAKVMPRHLAALLGISRGTASNWLNGRAEPQKLMGIKVLKIQAAIKVALDKKELPPPKNVRGDDKFSLIKAILKRHLTTGKA